MLRTITVGLPGMCLPMYRAIARANVSYPPAAFELTTSVTVLPL